MKKIREGDVVVIKNKMWEGYLGEILEKTSKGFWIKILTYKDTIESMRDPKGGSLHISGTIHVLKEELEVIDHIEDESIGFKNPQVGDVVVIHTNVGRENRYGWIGIVDYTLPKVGVRISEESIGFIAEYPAEVLEVIDHIDLEGEWNGNVNGWFRDYVNGGFFNNQSPLEGPVIPQDLGKSYCGLSMTSCSIKNNIGCGPCPHFHGTKNPEESVPPPPKKFEEDGWEYWLEKEEGELFLKKKCMHCERTVDVPFSGRVSWLGGRDTKCLSSKT